MIDRPIPPFHNTRFVDDYNVILQFLDDLDHDRNGWSGSIRQLICSTQYILPQDLQCFVRFLEQRAMRGAIECIKTFQRGVEFLKVGPCLRVGAGVIMDAFQEINGDFQRRDRLA